MILQSFKNRFEMLKKEGNNIQYVLDIGAYRGDFTETVKLVWPTCIVRQIEADDRQKQYLQNDAIISLLGDEVKESVEFFTLPEDQVTTGSSIFKEMTAYYTDAIIMKKQMDTIDNLNKTHNFYGNWKEHGLIKLDTQGSELMIVDGGKDFIASREVRYILIECSIVEYNKDSPRLIEVVKKMDERSEEHTSELQSH